MLVDQLHRRSIEGWQEAATRAVDRAPNKYRRTGARGSLATWSARSTDAPVRRTINF